MPSLHTIVRLALPAVLAGTIAACATSYGPENANGGYRETRLQPNVYRIDFKGNVRLGQAQTNEMALLRAAEVTLANGYVWFVSSGNAPTGSAVSLATNVVSVPATTLTITCFADRPDTAAPVYDARAVIESIGPKYLR
jgi:hypothetical protein